MKCQDEIDFKVALFSYLAIIWHIQSSERNGLRPDWHFSNSK